MQLLEKAGFQMRGKSLFSPSGEKVELEILVQRRSDERLALSWRRMLAGIGVDLKVRLIDSSQYQRRLQNFDFDLTAYNYYASLSPGNEQIYYWGSEAADTPGSRNYAGIKDFAVDTAATALTRAESRKISSAARALDRALMSGAISFRFTTIRAMGCALALCRASDPTLCLWCAARCWWMNHDN